MLRKTISKTVVGLLTVSLLAVGISTTTEASHYTQQSKTYTWNTYSYNKNTYSYGNYQLVWNGSSWQWVKKAQTQPVQPKPAQPKPIEPKPAPAPQQPTPSKPAENPAPSKEEAEMSEVQQVLDLVNAERNKAGLQPLKLNTELTNAATKKAHDMRDNNYFSHTSPTYGSPFDMMKQFGIRYSTAGENIAAGQRSPEDVMNGWMNSSGHRANILNKSFTEIGIGYVQGGSYGSYWVQMFIRP